MGMDLNGPNARGVGSHTGAKYALLLRKKKTKFSWLRFLKNKSDVFEALQVTLPLILSTLRKNRRLVILSDLGTEFCSEKVENLLGSLGIEHRYTARNSSLKNGVVERHFRTLEQDVATSMAQSALTKGFWPDLMETAHQVRLHLPSRSLPQHRSPFEEEKGEDSAPFREAFQPVGCLAVGHKVSRTSMGARGEELVYLGPKEGGDGTRLLDLATRRVVDDRSAVFHPNLFPCLLSKQMRKEVHQEKLAEMDALGLLEESAGGLEEDSADEEDEPWTEEEHKHDTGPRRSGRATGRPNTFQPTLEDQTRKFLKSADREGVPSAFFAAALRLCDDEAEQTLKALLAAGEDEDQDVEDDPVQFGEAMKKEHWRLAWRDELRKQEENGTYVWERAPPGAKVLGNMAVFRTKRDEHNNVVQHKARGVAMGNRQTAGDGTFQETFAPTVRMDTVRMFFAKAVEMGWPIRQADVVAAFLIPELSEDEVIYMRPFPGMIPPKGKEGCVLRLRKSLYGIKQAPYKWNKEMCSFMISQGYSPSSDPCLFLKKKEDKVVSITLFHVDDLLSSGEPQEVAHFMAALKKRFPIKDMGEPAHFLGMKISKTSAGYTWSQEAYLERLLEKFSMTEGRARETPISGRLYKQEEGVPTNAKKYRQLVGGLMYMMICTRPDICFALNQLTRHFQEPQEHHWKAALRVLAYLRGTKSLGVAFGKEESQRMKAFTRGKRDLTNEEGSRLVGWTDSDFAGDEESRKSTMGYLIQLGAGTIISFGCRKQAITATSSTTAELIALNWATKEVLWQKKLYNEIFDNDAGTVTIMEDNMGAKTLSESNKFSQKTKHLAVRYFFCREKVESKEIAVDHVKTAEQLADIFTKPLGPQVFVPLREKMGMVHCV